MIRILFIILSICCTVLCAFVAFLSDQAVESRAKQPLRPTTVSCCDLLDNTPTGIAHYQLVDFEPGKYFAKRDANDDGVWEFVSVPFFPDHWDRLQRNYPAAVVCFKNVANRAALSAIVEQGEIEVRYWPNRQTLDSDIHSRLASKYKSMDFSRCVVLHAGFDSPVPLLNSSIYVTSVALGAISMVVGLWNLLLLLVFDRRNSTETTDQTVCNRAGLPSLTDDGEVDGDMQDKESLSLPV